MAEYLFHPEDACDPSRTQILPCTAEHIDLGIPLHPENCPVAITMKANAESVGWANVETVKATPAAIAVLDCFGEVIAEYETSPRLSEWMETFDEQERTGETEFQPFNLKLIAPDPNFGNKIGLADIAE